MTLAHKETPQRLHLSICLMGMVVLSLQIVKVRDNDGQEFSRDSLMEVKRKLSCFITECRCLSPYGSLIESCKNLHGHHKLEE